MHSLFEAFFENLGLIEENARNALRTRFIRLFCSESIVSKTRINRQKQPQPELLEQPVSPRLIKGVAKLFTTLSYDRPVDTGNNNTINPEELLEVVSEGRDKSGTQKVKSKSKSVNLLLRAAFAALKEVHLSLESSQLTFVTVNLSRKASLEVENGGGAAYYGEMLKRKFKRALTTGKLKLLQKPSLFLVLENSKDGSLHAHIIMQHHPDDVAVLNKILRKGTDNHDNAVLFQTEYKLWLDANPGSCAWHRNVLDYDTDKVQCPYPHIGTDKRGREWRFYRIMPVDAGAADYISKELGKPLCDDLGASRMYIDKDIRSRAKVVYNEAYKLKQSIKKNMPVYEEAYANRRLEPVDGSDEGGEAFRTMLEAQGLL